MLSTSRRIVGAALATVCLVAAGITGIVGTVSPASADETCSWVSGVYKCTEVVTVPTPGQTTGPGSQEPTCDLAGAGGTDYSDKNRSDNFCVGDNVCFTTDLFTPIAPPEGEKPDEDSEARVTWCYDGIMGPPSMYRVFWSGDEEPPTLLEQAMTAIGRIDLSAPTINVSPSGRTLVNLDTWFWVSGTEREATGSSALGLVAIATFRSMTIDPGDGSGTFTCPWTVNRTDAEQDCFHEYRRASLRGPEQVGGRPAYAAKVTTVYDLRFEVDGEPVPRIDGAPATLDGPPAQTAVRVDEVQTTVERVR